MSSEEKGVAPWSGKPWLSAAASGRPGCSTNKKHVVGSGGPESLQGRQQRASTGLPPDQRRPRQDRVELLPANAGSEPHGPDTGVRLGLVQGAVRSL